MKKAATFFLAMLFLVSCGQVQTTPAAEPTLVVSTVTSAPTDISIPSMTPTSTLEPWMQSLPENVVSVKVDGEQIIGLDSNGIQTMVYNLDTSKWVPMTEPIVENVWDYLDIKEGSKQEIPALAEGLPVASRIFTDASFDGMWILNEGWTSTRTETWGTGAEEAMAAFNQRLLYQAWTNSGGDRKVTEAEYVEMVKQAQSTNAVADWEKVQIFIKTDLEVDEDGYDDSDRVAIWPGYTGDAAPEGVYPVTTVVRGFGDTNDPEFAKSVKILTQDSRAPYSGFGAHLVDGELVILWGKGRDASYKDGDTLSMVISTEAKQLVRGPTLKQLNANWVLYDLIDNTAHQQRTEAGKSALRWVEDKEVDSSVDD